MNRAVALALHWRSLFTTVFAICRLLLTICSRPIHLYPFSRPPYLSAIAYCHLLPPALTQFLCHFPNSVSCFISISLPKTVLHRFSICDSKLFRVSLVLSQSLKPIQHSGLDLFTVLTKVSSDYELFFL